MKPRQQPIVSAGFQVAIVLLSLVSVSQTQDIEHSSFSAYPSGRPSPSDSSLGTSKQDQLGLQHAKVLLRQTSWPEADPSADETLPPHSGSLTTLQNTEDILQQPAWPGVPTLEEQGVEGDPDGDRSALENAVESLSEAEAASEVFPSLAGHRSRFTMPDWGKKKWTSMTSWGKRDNEADKRWKEMSVWGKRDNEADKRWKEMSVWGKRDNEADKRWKEMSVWGKRDNEADKRWREMSVWGKRDSQNPDKRWKEMSVWGKRLADSVKKWREMSVWGKRENDKRWKNMAVWGKRSADPEMEKKWKEVASALQKQQDGTPDKKWTDLAVWGKRYLDSELAKRWKMATWGKRFPFQEQNKRWTEMAVWGKRASEDNTDLNEHSKEKGESDQKYKGWQELVAWGNRDNTNAEDLNKRWKEMSVWGKRDGGLSAIKKWNNMDLWGKRTFRYVRNWQNRGMWGKRPSWSRTGFTSWGKRSNEDSLHKTQDFLKGTDPLTDSSSGALEGGSKTARFIQPSDTAQPET